MRFAKASLELFGWLGICFASAMVGAVNVPGDWYAELRKPVWTPPGWLFGPVWTLLYATMAVAAWRIRRSGKPGRRIAIGLFLCQLFLNAAWSGLFFGLRRADLALLDCAALWLLILMTVVAFFRIDRLAGSLLAPYAAWVGFALALNFEIWRLNS